MTRRLQFAVSVFYAVLCIASLALWVRSNTWLESSKLDDHFAIVAPHWAFALVFAFLAFAPWAKNIGPPVPARFSLRTMFIATTLLAVVLGLAVWLVTLEARP